LKNIIGKGGDPYGENQIKGGFIFSINLPFLHLSEKKLSLYTEGNAQKNTEISWKGRIIK